MPGPILPIAAGVVARAAAKKAVTKVAKKAVSKGSQASKVKQATPSKIRVDGQSYTVTKTKTGKFQIQGPVGKKFTLKKGDTPQKLVSRVQAKDSSRTRSYPKSNDPTKKQSILFSSFNRTLKESSKKSLSQKIKKK
jgi:hypothetical protein